MAENSMMLHQEFRYSRRYTGVEGLYDPLEWVMAARVVATGRAQILLASRILTTLCGEETYQREVQRKDPATWAIFWYEFAERIKLETGRYKRVMLDLLVGAAGVAEFLLEFTAYIAAVDTIRIHYNCGIVQ